MAKNNASWQEAFSIAGELYHFHRPSIMIANNDGLRVRQLLSFLIV